MLKTIEFDYQFSNGVARKFSADLQAGSTMVTGKNGRGKSLILETFSFLLFGTQALRGIAEDYKKISTRCLVTIRGKDYEISRTKSKADIRFAGEEQPLASGTSAVNAFIINLLGYDYNVYRLSNWCAQGEIQALAQMKPKERKEMIDQVAGLNQVDVLIEFIKQEIKLIKANITGIESVTTKPLEPEAPRVPQSELQILETKHKALMDALQGFDTKRKDLQAVLMPREVPVPLFEALALKPDQLPEIERQSPREFPVFNIIAPEKPAVIVEHSPESVTARVNEMSNTIDGYNLRRSRSEQKITELKRLAGDWVQYLDLTVNTTLEYWQQQNDYWTQKQSYEALLNQGQVNCPNCGHGHPVASEALKAFDTSLFPVNKPISYQTATILFSLRDELEVLAQVDRDITATFGGASQMEAVMSRLVEILLEIQSYDKAMAEYSRARMTFEQEYRHVEQMNASIETNYQAQCQSKTQRDLERLQSWERECARVQQVNADKKAQFDAAIAEYNEKARLYGEAQAELEALIQGFDYDLKFREAVEVRDQMNELVVQWRVYTQMHNQYLEHMRSYEQVQVRLESERKMLDDRERAYKALQDLKARVKTYLIPSLNKVASYLLSEMTGGDFNTVNIDDDFEVYVDGQALRTMSGSAKDVTNLALRIGLGRILTHKVLGMMMLDEIDQGMDAERAAYTWQCIERVTPQIGQVLVVSHKDLNSENRLEVA